MAPQTYPQHPSFTPFCSLAKLSHTGSPEQGLARRVLAGLRFTRYRDPGASTAPGTCAAGLPGSWLGCARACAAPSRVGPGSISWSALSCMRVQQLSSGICKRRHSVSAACVSLPAAWHVVQHTNRLNPMQQFQGWLHVLEKYVCRCMARRPSETLLQMIGRSQNCSGRQQCRCGAVTPARMRAPRRRWRRGGQRRCCARSPCVRTRTSAARAQGRRPPPRAALRSPEAQAAGCSMHCGVLARSCASPAGTKADAGGAVADGPARSTPCSHLVLGRRHIQRAIGNESLSPG